MTATATLPKPQTFDEVVYDDPNVLLERDTAGLSVKVAYLPLTQLVSLTVAMDGRQVAHTVPPDKVLDAFNHPVLYLSEAQVAELGVR